MNKHRGSDFNEFIIEENLMTTDQPMTPTPRTDEAADRFPQPGQPPGAQWPEIVPAEFARQLERELADKSESLAFQTQLNREVIEREKQTFAELAAERALADKLAETLANVQGDYATTGAITTPEVDTALAAWKEARIEQ